MRDYIDAAAFKEMILCAQAALHANIKPINELNVFPVPDGDTGTNMCLTMQNAADELRKKDFDTISAAADCTANALLRGARGNSGVILSLLFRGMSRRMKGLETAGSVEFAGAMKDGVDAAYKAVMKPAEGTILTVSRLASKAANDAAQLGADLEGVFICALKAGRNALAETQNQNPVLKKAGVIDAGGMGYIVILEAMLASLKGEIVSGEAAAPAEPAEEGNVFGVFDPSEITFAYDTVYIVRKSDPDVDLMPLREYLDSIGDSLVISEGDEEFKVHVHTNIPGVALTESQKYGTLELAKIENMRTQHEDVSAGRKARTTDDLAAVEDELEQMEQQEEVPEVAEAEKQYGTVAVCAGAGLEELFYELGTDRIVTGGQTMNPSTDDILREINHTPASTVFVLPNNKNIIMAAEQCIPLTEKKVIVLPTKTVPQGITAMLNFNPDNEDAEELRGEMQTAVEKVHTAMVTYAARDSDFDGHSIHAGEYLALLDGALLGSYSNIPTLFKELSWALDEFSPEFITVYYGENVQEEEANAASETLSGNFPDAEVSVFSGGQPVYYYMISAE
ncbi:MAG: DAK2 domain-containing protein [Oscillospiraceae bacterium]|nr:DAK2 domain-containing protein [Oscillospiraceae bacterium]